MNCENESWPWCTFSVGTFLNRACLREMPGYDNRTIWQTAPLLGRPVVNFPGRSYLSGSSHSLNRLDSPPRISMALADDTTRNIRTPSSAVERSRARCRLCRPGGLDDGYPLSRTQNGDVQFARNWIFEVLYLLWKFFSFPIDAQVVDEQLSNEWTFVFQEHHDRI